MAQDQELTEPMGAAPGEGVQLSGKRVPGSWFVDAERGDAVRLGQWLARDGTVSLVPAYRREGRGLTRGF